MNKTWLGVLAWTCFWVTGAGNEAGAASIVSFPETTFWRLNSIPGEPAVTEDTVVEIEFDTIFLSVTCTSVGYAVVQGDKNFGILNSYTSSNTCPGKIRPRVVEAYESALKRTKAYRLEGNELTLLDGSDQPTLILSMLVAPGIENRRWSIESYFDGNSPKLAAQRFRSIPLQIQNGVVRPWMTLIHGQIYGTPGCGGFFGSYSLNGERLNLDFGSLLAGYCVEEALQVERGVIPALRGDRLIRQEADRILLTDTDGRVQIVLVPWNQRALK